mgnify:CR=1|jgi:hypothetical protein|nr:MAG TPA: Protein of unknown function (DUF739) [Caudoviricetes sp.]DAK22482.1 MAG TPA: Protein of unknown function (DUF739) [Caudoviricetes sp.]
MNKDALKSAIVKRGMKVEDFIQRLDLEVDRDFTRDVYYSRLSGRTEFKRDEMVACKKVLGLTDGDVMEIFFTDKVS